MSLHVSTVGRWMHHDCGGRLGSKVRILQLSQTSQSFSSSGLLRTRKCIRTRHTTKTCPPFRHPAIQRSFAATLAISSSEASSSPHNPPPAPLHRDLQALPGNEDAHNENDVEQRSVNEPQNGGPAITIRLSKFPVSSEYADHPGIFADFPRLFAVNVAAIYKAYFKRGFRRGTPVERIRNDFGLDFDRSIRMASAIWTSRHEAGLTNWLDHPTDNYKRAWKIVDLLLGSLLISAPRMLAVLQTLRPLDGDFEVRAHCLYLTGWLYKSELSADPELMATFDKEVHKLQDVDRWPEDRIGLDHLRLLLWRSDELSTKTLLKNLMGKYRQLDKRTLLWLTLYCSTQYAMYDEAFSIFSKVAAEDLQNPTETVSKACRVLLKHDEVVVTPNGPNFRYLSDLLARGLAPDSLTYDRIIERALDSGFPGVAWDVYHHLQTLTTPTHWQTHRRLLKQAFDSRNVDGVDEIMSRVYRNEELYHNYAVLGYAMNMVRRMIHTSPEASAMQGVSQIVALYDRKYLRYPLSRFGIVRQGEVADVADLVEPKPFSLAHTVWACVLCHKSGPAAEKTWRRITTAVEAGDEIVLACMRYDLIYNAFIWVNCLHAVDLRNALQILQYMLEKQFCLPTARTWSIVICGFLYHGQKDQASKLYDLMVQHGFRLEHVYQELVPHSVHLADLEVHAAAVLDPRRDEEGIEQAFQEAEANSTAKAEGGQEEVFGVDVQPTEFLYGDGVDPLIPGGTSVSTSQAGRT